MSSSPHKTSLILDAMRMGRDWPLMPTIRAELAAALFLAQCAHWIYPAGATGRYETCEQRGCQEDRNHDRKSRWIGGPRSVYQLFQETPQPAQVMKILKRLEEPHRTMVSVAAVTGMGVRTVWSEVARRGLRAPAVAYSPDVLSRRVRNAEKPDQRTGDSPESRLGRSARAAQTKQPPQRDEFGFSQRCRQTFRTRQSSSASSLPNTPGSQSAKRRMARIPSVGGDNIERNARAGANSTTSTRTLVSANDADILRTVGRGIAAARGVKIRGGDASQLRPGCAPLAPKRRTSNH
jgi:hypothetical protein